MGSNFLRILAFSLGFMGIQFAFTGVFRAAGSTMLAMVLGIISMFILEIPLAYFLSKWTNLAIDGIWWAFPITNVLMAGITWRWYQKGDWKNSQLTEKAIIQEEVLEEVLVETGK